MLGIPDRGRSKSRLSHRPSQTGRSSSRRACAARRSHRPRGVQLDADGPRVDRGLPHRYPDWGRERWQRRLSAAAQAREREARIARCQASSKGTCGLLGAIVLFIIRISSLPLPLVAHLPRRGSRERGTRVTRAPRPASPSPPSTVDATFPCGGRAPAPSRPSHDQSRTRAQRFRFAGNRSAPSFRRRHGCGPGGSAALPRPAPRPSSIQRCRVDGILRHRSWPSCGCPRGGEGGIFRKPEETSRPCAPPAAT